MSPEWLRQLERDVVITYPNDKSLIILKNDATTLLGYLKKGNRLNGVVFKFKKIILPVNVSQILYFVDQVLVLGKPCNTIEAIQAVLTDIKINQDLEELENIWEVASSINSIPYSKRSNNFKQLMDTTASLISDLDEYKKLKSEIEYLSTIRIADYGTDAIEQFIKNTDYSDALEQQRLYKEKVNGVYKYLASENNHPIASSIILAMDVFDFSAYSQHISDIVMLTSEKEKYRHYKNIEDSLNKNFPNLVNDILQGSFDVIIHTPANFFHYS